MNRTALSVGAKSIDRGSTFKSPTTSGGGKLARRAISPASPAQRARVRGAVSIVTGEGPCDPAHLWPRGRGGCDDVLCVIPLTRLEHEAFDRGDLDVLGALLAHGLVAEIQHALGHADGNLIGLLHRLTGDRYVSERSIRGEGYAA